MRDRHPAAQAPGRPDSGGRAHAYRPGRRERLGDWIECVLDFGDALDVAEIQPVLAPTDAVTVAPARARARG